MALDPRQELAGERDVVADFEYSELAYEHIRFCRALNWDCGSGSS